MKKIRAIPTQYNGYKFRSRLEARWAVFFDALNIDYEYEPEGFYLSDGRKYLPDFRITNRDGSQLYYEIKRKNSEGDGKLECLIKDLQKTIEYDEKTGKVVSNYIFGEVLSGDPIDVLMSDKYGICPRCLEISKDIESIKWFDPVHYYENNIYCFNCDIYGDRDYEESPLGYLHYIHKGDVILNIDNGMAVFYRIILNAANDARAVQFEHGENPRKYGAI